MKQQGKLTLENAEALQEAKSEGEKERNGFSRAALEVSLFGGGRLMGQGGNQSRLLAVCVHALCLLQATSQGGFMLRTNRI